VLNSITAVPRVLLAIAWLALAPAAGLADRADPDAGTPTIRAADLSTLLARRGTWVLFDAREEVEFTVSHITGAIPVPKGIDYAAFVTVQKERVRGKTVVFYCSTSSRSAEFALGVEDDLLRAGAGAVYVLEGGLFAWHNERRALVDAKGPTEYLHPFQPELKSRMTRPDLARWAPRT
jgi:rhodanese-related sulfurtransferase